MNRCTKDEKKLLHDACAKLINRSIANKNQNKRTSNEPYQGTKNTNSSPIHTSKDTKETNSPSSPIHTSKESSYHCTKDEKELLRNACDKLIKRLIANKNQGTKDTNSSPSSPPIYTSKDTKDANSPSSPIYISNKRDNYKYVSDKKRDNHIHIQPINKIYSQNEPRLLNVYEKADYYINHTKEFKYSFEEMIKPNLQAKESENCRCLKMVPNFTFTNYGVQNVDGGRPETCGFNSRIILLSCYILMHGLPQYMHEVDDMLDYARKKHSKLFKDDQFTNLSKGVVNIVLAYIIACYDYPNDEKLRKTLYIDFIKNYNERYKLSRNANLDVLIDTLDAYYSYAVDENKLSEEGYINTLNTAATKCENDNAFNVKENRDITHDVDLILVKKYIKNSSNQNFTHEIAACRYNGKWIIFDDVKTHYITGFYA